jgi:hypothetical protein
MKIIILALLIITLAGCSESAAQARPGADDVALTGDEQVFADYIEYNTQMWSGILTGLKQGDFTAWNNADRFMGCTQSQTALPLAIAQNAFKWWSEMNISDLIIRDDFGLHNNYRVLIIRTKDGDEVSLWGYTDVAGFRLAHNCCQRMFAYDGDTFRDVRDAYEAGLLSQADISAIYDAHFIDCNESKAPGEWNAEAGDVNARELRWATTPNGNHVSVNYNISHFEHLDLTEEELREEVLRIADVMVEHIMPRAYITSVISVGIEKQCIFDFTQPDDANSFYTYAGLQHDSGMQSLSERSTVHRSADGSYKVI